MFWPGSAPEQPPSLTAAIEEGLRPPDPDAEALRAEAARDDLSLFVREAWPIVEPAKPLLHNWHIDAICYYLTAVKNGEILNLLMNVPPGFLKSLITTVFFPAWEWIDAPHHRYITAANRLDLATRDTAKCRRLISSEWYRRHYGDSFFLTSDQNQKTRYNNNHEGYRIAATIGGATGERGSRVIFDDPHQIDDKETAIQEAVDYYNNTLASRISDPLADARIVIQQRVWDSDLSGDLLDKMEEGGEVYEVLTLSMQHSPSLQAKTMYRNVLEWTDPRGQEEGALLDPRRYPRPVVDAALVRHADRAQAIINQNPGGGRGSIYKAEWWEPQDARFIAGLPVLHEFTGDRGNFDDVRGRYLFFDTAEKDNEQAAFTGWGVVELLMSHRIRWTEIDRTKVEMPGLLELVEGKAYQWNDDGLLSGVILEDKSSGTGAYQMLRHQCEDWLYELLLLWNPGRASKDERDRLASPYCQMGGVLLPYVDGTAWPLADFMEQELFKARPKKRDRRDVFTMGVLYLEHYLADWRRSKLHHLEYLRRTGQAVDPPVAKPGLPRSGG